MVAAKDSPAIANGAFMKQWINRRKTDFTRSLTCKSNNQVPTMDKAHANWIDLKKERQLRRTEQFMPCMMTLWHAAPVWWGCNQFNDRTHQSKPTRTHTYVHDIQKEPHSWILPEFMIGSTSLGVQWSMEQAEQVNKLLTNIYHSHRLLVSHPTSSGWGTDGVLVEQSKRVPSNVNFFGGCKYVCLISPSISKHRATLSEVIWSNYWDTTHPCHIIIMAKSGFPWISYYITFFTLPLTQNKLDSDRSFHIRLLLMNFVYPQVACRFP